MCVFYVHLISLVCFFTDIVMYVFLKFLFYSVIGSTLNGFKK